MGKRTIAVIIAILLALAAAALVWWYVSGVREDVAAEEESRSVLTATQTISARTTGEDAVERGLVELTEVPARLVAPGALTQKSELRGKVFAGDVAAGQQVIAEQLTTPEEKGLSFRLEQGMRAVSVPIDRTRGVGSRILPGDRVDVIATFDAGAFGQGGATLADVLPPETLTSLQASLGEEQAGTLDVPATFTYTLLPQTEVLEIDLVDQAAQDGSLLGGGEESSAPDNPVVILAVTPQQAEKLVFAQQQGVIWFALVPADDEEPASTLGRALFNELR